MSKTILFRFHARELDLTELLPKQLQWFPEKEKTKVGGGKAGGQVAEQPEADEVLGRSSPGGETPGDQSNTSKNGY